MTINAAAMPPFNTTLMGVLKAVLDSYGAGVTAPFLFGASGHAFLINIHEQLCPSGPYCWKRARFDGLLRNTGVEMVTRGVYGPESSAAERAAIEAEMRSALDRG